MMGAFFVHGEKFNDGGKFTGYLLMSSIEESRVLEDVHRQDQFEGSISLVDASIS